MAVEIDAPIEVEDEPAAKKKKLSIRPLVYDNFTLISNPEESRRIQGCVSLLKCLVGNSEEKSRELKYALKRTIRGVGSKQNNTRLGFYVALVGLLETHIDIPIDDIVDLIEKELHVNKNSKSETGDVYMGHILTCGAVLRSGLYHNAPNDQKLKIINMLMVASKQKVYLALVAYLFILDFVDKVSEDQFQSSLWPQLKGDFSQPLTSYNLDSLYFILRVSLKFPNSLKKFLKHNFGVAKVIHEDNIHTIAEKLMLIPDLSVLNHPIYEIIGQQVVKLEYFDIFWTSGIESCLDVPNRNRELVAITLATVIVKNANADVLKISSLISENFLMRILDRFRSLHSLGNNKKRKVIAWDEDRKLIINKAKEFFEALAKVLKVETVDVGLKLDILDKLLFYPGDILFPQITASSITRTIFASLDGEGVMKFTKRFKEVLFNESKKRVVGGAERYWVNAERLQAAEILSYLVAHRAVANETSWRTENLKYLLQFTIFRTLDGNNSDVSPTLAAAVKNSLYRSLNCKIAKLDVRVDILKELAKYIDQQLANPKILMKIEKIFPEQSQNSWMSMRKFTYKLEKAIKIKPSKENTVFLILSLQLGLFLFSDPKIVELAHSSLQELQSCYDNYKKKENRVREFGSEDAEPQWIEVLMEVFLSILSHECNLLRFLVSSVFHHLCGFLTQSALQQIVSVLDPESNPLSKEDEEESNEEDSGDDNDDAEKPNENGISEETIYDEENESDIEMSEEEDDEELKVADQFKLEVRKALGNAAPDTDTESVDADLIDEEEGKRIDTALSNAFKMLQKSKNKKSKGERMDDLVLLHFRIRILDLIDIYTEKALSMDNCLNLLNPLLHCLEFAVKNATQKPLENRLRKSIKVITSIKSFSENNVTINGLAEYLKLIIDKGSRSQFVYQAIGDKIAECSMFIARCAQNITKNKEKSTSKKQDKQHLPLVNIFSESLDSFFKNRNCLLPVIMFNRVLRLEWSGNWTLLSIIVQNVFDINTRQFRKHEGIQLISNFYKNINRAKINTYEQRFVTFESHFSKCICESLGDDVFLSSCKKDHFFILLLQLLLLIRSLHRSTFKNDGYFRWSEIKNVFSNVLAKEIIKNVKPVKKLCLSLEDSK